MLTIRPLSLGRGFNYLMDSIVAGDGAVEHSSALTRYYAESGTPPGVFLGSGLAGLGGGEGVERGSQVSEEHLYRMLGLRADPLTSTPVGHPVKSAEMSVLERIESRLARMPSFMTADERAAKEAEITADEERKAQHRSPPVAGFDLTFSPRVCRWPGRWPIGGPKRSCTSVGHRPRLDHSRSGRARGSPPSGKGRGAIDSRRGALAVSLIVWLPGPMPSCGVVR